MSDELRAQPAYCGEPRPFDGRIYRVTLLDGTVFEPCHAMPQFRGDGYVMVVPAVNGVGGAVVGSGGPRLGRVECIGIHNMGWVCGEQFDPGADPEEPNEDPAAWGGA